MINLSGYLTTDEGNWMGRTALFTKGLLTGDPASTYQSGHPGVMTMWESLLGMGPDRALALVEYVRPDGLEKAPNYLETLHLARRTFAIVTSLGVAAIALLSWRLFGAGVGLIAGVLLALEPFFLAHSVVAHVDSNVTTWMTVCILSALDLLLGRRLVGVPGDLRGGGRAGVLEQGALGVPAAVRPAHCPESRWERRGDLRNGSAWLRLVRDGAVWGVLALAIAMLLWPSFRWDRSARCSR